MHTAHFNKRKSGISLIGDLPWGSHFCQFYQTTKDLIDVLAPYFRAGLDTNEFCVWVTPADLAALDARKALKITVPRFEEYTNKGQFEIVPHTRWRAWGAKSGTAVAAMIDKAVAGGFDGVRLACNAVKTGNGFACHGADAVSRYNALAVYAYPRDEFDALGLMEIVKNHRFALVRNAGKWEVIKSSEAQIVKDELKRSEEKLKSLFSNMSEGFAYHRIVLDRAGRPCDYVFLEVNDAFERLTGLKAKRIIGKKATEALPGIEQDPTDWFGKYGKVALTGKPVQFESYSEALQRWYAVSAFSPHKGYFAVTFGDITDRKHSELTIRKLNQELAQRVKDLTSANSELESFSYSVSHDLRAPLRSIDGFSKMLLDDCPDKLGEDDKDMLLRIRASSRRMGQLIDGLLNLSRLSRSELVRGQVDLSALAQGVAGELAGSRPERDVEFVIAEGLACEGDERLLYAVLQNLLDNAWKFTEKCDKARIEFGVTRGKGRKAYFVKDNGAGFDMAYVNRLFSPFQRLHDAGEYAGTGIGLATIQRIIGRHGGSVWAEGEVGKGATFYFTL
jgi:PAS domain S-box-containing protein